MPLAYVAVLSGEHYVVEIGSIRCEDGQRLSGCDRNSRIVRIARAVAPATPA